MVLRSRRPIAQASNARMRKLAEMRIRKQMKGRGIVSELAKIFGPLIIKEGIKIGSAVVQKKIAGKKKKKKGGALRPTGSRAPARRRVAPRSAPVRAAKRSQQPKGAGRKKKGGRHKY